MKVACGGTTTRFLHGATELQAADVTGPRSDREAEGKKVTITEIARQLCKGKSTISRELRRNAETVTPQDRLFYFGAERFWSEEQLDEYIARLPAEEQRTHQVWTQAQAQAVAGIRAWRANQKRCRKRPETRTWVIAKLREGWSPQQIAGRSKLDGPEPVSHEYVYAFLHRDRKRGGKLFRLLKRYRKRKRRLSSRDYPKAAPAPRRPSIEDRPRIVTKRSRLGDCEADLIVGYRQSGYILTVVDRKSRAAVLRLVTSKADECRTTAARVRTAEARRSAHVDCRRR